MKNLEERLTEKKAAGYIRVSTVYQIDKDSLPMQREDLSNYIRYALGIENYEIFEDAGYSAKNTERPAFQRMMSRLRSGEFSHVVVWKIDRISRNLIDFATMYEELKRLGITFVSKNEQFDTSSAMGEAMLKIILVFAELERKMTSERVSAVMVSRANEGKYNGGRIPFGYDYDKSTKQISVNEEEAKIVNLIYDKYEELQSLMRVAKYLNSRGIKSKRGFNYTPTTVHKILTSPFYVGDLVYNKHDERSLGNSSTLNVRDESEWITVENHHPAIIDRARQASIKSSLSSRNFASVSQKTYQRKNVHIFSGLVQCGSCGASMVASTDRVTADGYRPSCYLCSSRRSHKGCTNKFISDKTLGPFVFNLIANIVKAHNNVGKSTTVTTLTNKLLRGEAMRDVASIDREGAAHLLKAITESSDPQHIIITESGRASSGSDEMELLRSELKKHENALARLQQLFLYGDEAISHKDYMIQKQSIENSISSLKERVKELNASIEDDYVMSDTEFFDKASMFIIQSSLNSLREVDFNKIIRTVDVKTLKLFIKKVVKNIVILDGNVSKITFRNDISLRFTYKK